MNADKIFFPNLRLSVFISGHNSSAYSDALDYGLAPLRFAPW
jgi:hypothetical protein